MQADRNSAVSTICATLQPGVFATGGYDHLVHLWSYSGERLAVSSTSLPIRHTAVVQSLLAIRDTSQKLVTAGADCTVNIFDLSSERVVNTLKLSNSVYHVHPTMSEFCTLLEIGHREQQFEMRDHRLVPVEPVIRFGYPSAKVHGRFTRGAIQDTTFACGGSEKDGCVRLWDLRKPTQVLCSVPCLPGRKVIQLAFGNEMLVASSEDHYLAFVNPIGDPADSR
ncbi:WD40-repeat-containing domain protein [Trametes gibbosa]|nr:WD40-repeat-containing domain protein [Trametes gibbosa]